MVRQYKKFLTVLLRNKTPVGKINEKNWDYQYRVDGTHLTMSTKKYML